MTDELQHTQTDEQGLTVWERLDAYYRAILQISSRVDTLERRYADLLLTLARAAPTLQQPPTPFGSIDKLVEQVERMFDCRDGDHRGVHQVWNTERSAFDHYPYSVLGLIAPSSIPDVRERLRQEMYAAFLKLKQTCKSERPVLYWRYAKECRMLEDTEYGGREQTRHKINTRIAIPEADFNAVEDVVKTDNNSYRELKG
jgi:hypothetical protein